jgi:hypothetical protein
MAAPCWDVSDIDPAGRGTFAASTFRPTGFFVMGKPA